MKKTLASVILGIALLAVSGVANAEQRRTAEPRWGIRPDRTGASSPLDLARWLGRHLLETVASPVPGPLFPPPPSDPETPPAPVSPDEVCVPERQHCPMG